MQVIITKSKINNHYKAKQLIDFAGLNIDGYIYPTDLDGIIEYKDSEYILFEIKYGEAEVPIGQRLALQRMVDDFTKAGKKAIALIGEHTVRNIDTPIVAAWCKVREFYDGRNKVWTQLKNDLTIKNAIANYQRFERLSKQEDTY